MPTSPPKRGGWMAIIVAAVLVFGTAYGGAYLWLMGSPPGERWKGRQRT